MWFLLYDDWVMRLKASTNGSVSHGGWRAATADRMRHVDRFHVHLWGSDTSGFYFRPIVHMRHPRGRLILLPLRLLYCFCVTVELSSGRFTFASFYCCRQTAVCGLQNYSTFT